MALKILILHRLGPQESWSENVADLEMAFPRYAIEHDYIIHDASFKLPSYIKNYPFDLIILNSSFLCNVFTRKRTRFTYKYFSFLSESDAFKVALPQDDYYCSDVLDRLLIDFDINLLVTVLPQHVSQLLPLFSSSSRKIIKGYTGYLSERMIKNANKFYIERSKRDFDLVYRASSNPSFPNKLAYLKANLGRIIEHNINKKYHVDINPPKNDFLNGLDWWSFLANARVTLGSNSGSDFIIRNHNCEQYLTNKKISNEKKISYIDHEDKNKNMTALSPRNIEAAILGTTQSIVSGDYGGLFIAGEDYFELDDGLAKVDELNHFLGDYELQERLAASAKEKILDTKELRIESLIENIMIHFREEADDFSKSSGNFKMIKEKYQNHEKRFQKKIYQFRLFKQKIGDIKRSFSNN